MPAEEKTQASGLEEPLYPMKRAKYLTDNPEHDSGIELQFLNCDLAPHRMLCKLSADSASQAYGGYISNEEVNIIKFTYEILCNTLLNLFLVLRNCEFFVLLKIIEILFELRAPPHLIDAKCFVVNSTKNASHTREVNADSGCSFTCCGDKSAFDTLDCGPHTRTHKVSLADEHEILNTGIGKIGCLTAIYP